MEDTYGFMEHASFPEHRLCEKDVFTDTHTYKSPENTLMVFNPDHLCFTFLHEIRADAKVPHLIWEQQ